MLDQPTSSPMMTTMLGFLFCAFALGVPATPNIVATAANAKLNFELHFILYPPIRYSIQPRSRGTRLCALYARTPLPIASVADVLVYDLGSAAETLGRSRSFVQCIECIKTIQSLYVD